MNLLVHIRNGDEFAFRQLYEACKEKVLNYFVKKINSGHDAEDLLQNTFLRLWKYRKSLSDDYLIEQHLFHIARTVLIDYIRKQNKVQLIKKAAAEIPQSALPQETFLESKALEGILKKMPELRRKVFILHKMEGYSYKEIAHKLSVDVKAIDNNISRALKQIRKALLLLFIYFF
ncbi:RNA polymerase sigma factor [Agriterribacter sp.]|uniref:RNA polymerase sigma factor n=1 Tax=Agriterribacter sp. TaxID=2821509 RepID=UPI002BB36283|nr:sigma-70 family RNA polymerase sigma factor [Agriterribacter sp.]HTN05886.1 sigma-70 family RNA polymerase sigma factor [Agriterribacter sp.]